MLWFAFKLISLSYWIQPIQHCSWAILSCDLLSNLYLCHIEYSDNGILIIPVFVVICFQTYIFVILNTACLSLINWKPALWFAFKLISLSYWIQLIIKYCNIMTRCDLLSNLYLCHIEYSHDGGSRRALPVVICFQTYIFVILNTANNRNEL